MSTEMNEVEECHISRLWYDICISCTKREFEELDRSVRTRLLVVECGLDSVSVVDQMLDRIHQQLEPYFGAKVNDL
jgi:hypothetical protein